MSRVRIEKLERHIEREVSSIIMNEVKDNKVGFITVTGVDLTNDLSFATIYFTVLGKEERSEAAIKALDRAKGFIRRELGQRIQVRKVPDLIFKYDDSLEYGNKIESLIRDIKK